jgi:ribosomal protein L33
MTDENAVVLSCSSCKSAHYLTLATVTSKASPASQMVGEEAWRSEPFGRESLRACVSAHHASLSLREMDVFQDAVRLRCAECRRHYDLIVSAFETRQK